MFPVFDLHCDTLTCLYDGNFSLKNAPLHISDDKAKNIFPYCQIFAIWTDYNLNDDDGYERYNKIIEFSKKKNIDFSTNPPEENKSCRFLAIEDARILNNDISRIYKLYSDGVRFLTLTWKGTTCIGGSWDTSDGLSDFGKEVVKTCFKTDIIPDISHASYECAKEVVSLSEKYGCPIIATHSNSYSVCPHERNLRDDLFYFLANNGYAVGISLAPQHLNLSGKAKIYDILKHIEHYLSLGGENSVCLGCDFDGVDSLPEKIHSISDLEILYSESISQFGKDFADKLFFGNAFNYFKKYIQKG